MLSVIGTKVRFRYTGESGVVTALLDEGMLQVRLDDNPDLEIPAFEEDLISDSGVKPGSEKPKSVPNNKPEPPPRRTLKAGYHILKPKGLQIVFEPMPGRDGIVTRYNAWLVNDTPQEFLFELDIYSTNRDIIYAEEKIEAATALELGFLLFDDLNEAPEILINARRITTEGTDTPLQNTIKIRAKQFFNNLQAVPILNVTAHRYLLFDAAPSAKTTEPENLIDYTRQNLRPGKITGSAKAMPVKVSNVEEFASFIPEIDLHVENLISGYARLGKGEIIRIQLLHFQRFMDKAVRLGVPRIFVIHGVGEGKLREAIADRLREHPEVSKFRNEFHHKYGYGATEVIFH